MRTAKQIICGCPEMCYDVLNTSGELIRLKAGESGFYRCDQRLPKRLIAEGTYRDMDELADHWNDEMGVTKGQRQAMNWGTMFEWTSSMADPLSYDKDGNFIKESETS